MHQPKARSEAGRQFDYTALGLVAAATLMLQIIETRIISVVSGVDADCVVLREVPFRRIFFLRRAERR